jgi:hypothetical protein
MLRRISYTQIGIFAGGALALALTAAGSEKWINPIYMCVWCLAANFALFRLKCVRCGKRLAIVPPFFARGFGLDTCLHCGEQQPP